MSNKSDFLKYPSYTSQDEKWGLVCTTVGYQNVKPHTPVSYTHLTLPTMAVV